MGNGVIDDITDFIYVMPDKFNYMLTTEMAAEIDLMNEKMLQETAGMYFLDQEDGAQETDSWEYQLFGLRYRMLK